MPTQDILLAWHRLRNALGAAGMGTWHVDLDTGVATHDESLNRILGLESVETEGRLRDAGFTRIHPDDQPRVMRAIDNAIAARSEYSIEYRVVRADGEVRWLQDRGRIILDDQGEPRFATGAVMDVTARRQLEDHERALSEERAQLIRDLEQANRVKDEFLAMLSHELRTPLNAVLGWTRMLRRGTVPPGRRASILDTIERNAAAQMQIIEELLDLSSMSAGNLRLNIAPLDLRELIGGAVETIRPAADAKSIALQVSIDAAIGEMTGDAARLRQVLWNLLANAVKFTPAGGRVEVSAREGPSDLEFVVKDSGDGIDPAFLPHVFEPFRRGESLTTRTVGGLGLGLAIVRHLVEAHGGTVTADNNGSGTGSIFVVRMPTGRAARQGHVMPLTLRGRRVLAVDDDVSTQELVATMLVMYGVSVRTAGRASDAIKILSEWRPDVLLTDIAMPGEDGYALIRRVRALPSTLGAIPAVAVTAFTDPQSVQNAFAAGFDAHLGKPLEPHVLADALTKVLRVRKSA
ncbi:MAG TPA: ATP-binding protein [Vicinamibacterales bacterium]|nr:ATP-binding protein [Vicinamibacterales bacterium]